MSINIKNREAEALIAELKRRTGKGTTDLLLDLLRREKERVDGRHAQGIDEGMESARELQQAWRSLPVIDPRSPEDILGYDENGLPT